LDAAYQEIQGESLIGFLARAGSKDYNLPWHFPDFLSRFMALEVHAAFLDESRTRGSFLRSVQEIRVGYLPLTVSS
jgi:hypothetical protein